MVANEDAMDSKEIHREKNKKDMSGKLYSSWGMQIF
jgi:hypothetical protein